MLVKQVPSDVIALLYFLRLALVAMHLLHLSSLLPGLICDLPHLLFLLRLLVLSNAQLHLRPGLDRLSCLSLSNRQGFCHLREVLINVDLLQSPEE